MATKIDFKPVAEGNQIDFQPIDFTPVESAEPIQFKPLDQTPVPAEAPAPGLMTSEELAALQQKYNLSPAQLEEVKRELPVMGAYVAGETPTLGEKASRAVGVVGRAAGVQGLASRLSREGIFGIGRKEEGVIKALEDAQALINERKSGAETALEIATGFATPALVGKTLKGAVAAGATMGAAAGYGSAREGESVAPTAVGTAAGAGLGAAGHKLAQVLGKFVGSNVAQEVTESPAAREFQQALAKEMEATAPVQRAIEDAVSKPEILRDGEAFTRWYQALPAETKQAFLKDAPTDKLTEKLLGKAAGTETAEATLIFQKVRQELADVASYIKAGRRIEKLAPQTANEAETILKESARQGQRFLKDATDELYIGKAAQRVTANSLDAQFGLQGNPIKEYVLAVLDGRDRLGIYDARLTTDLEVAAARSARNLARLSDDLATIGKIARRVDKLFRALPGDQAITRQRIFDAIQEDTDDALSRLSLQELNVVTEYKKATDELAELLNKAAGEKLLTPEEGKRYVLNTVVDMPEFIRRMSARADAIKEQTGIDILGNPESFASRMDELKQNAAFEEFRKGLALFGREADTAEKVSFFGKQAMSPTALRENYQVLSTSLKAREGKIPEFLLEKDPVKLIVKWGENNLRPMYMSPFLSALTKGRNIAIAKGDGEAAEYISNLITNLTGTRRKTIASGTRDLLLGHQAKMLRKADKATNPISKGFYSIVSLSPEIMPMLFNQVYPNFLGLSPRAILGNLTQPFTMTVPELGAPGMVYAMRAYGRLAPRIKEILGEEAREKLIKEGLVGRSHSTELAYLKSGLERGALWKASNELLQKQAEFAMYLFERSELINRLVVKEIGQDLAANFVKGTGSFGKHARGFVKTLPISYQKAFAAAGTDVTKITELFQDYLIAKTLFNYNPQTMSAYGRFMGPMLSAFTKWPASIAGDIVRTLMKKNKIKAGGELAVRYLGPVAALTFLAQGIPDDVKEGGAYQRVFGPDGPVSVAPLQTTKALAEGQIFTPPVVATVRDLGTGLLTADPSKLWRWANNTFEAFMPGAWVGRLLGSDIPAIFQDERRKGTYTQRLGETFGVEDIDEMFRPEEE